MPSKRFIFLVAQTKLYFINQTNIVKLKKKSEIHQKILPLKIECIIYLVR